MNVVLCDDELIWKNFLPLTFTRPVSEIRIGILTIREKWDLALGVKCSYLSQSYLSKKFQLNPAKQSIYINSNYLPDPLLSLAIKQMDPGDLLCQNENVIARYPANDIGGKEFVRKIEYNKPLFSITHVWDIFQKNGEAIKADFDILTKGRSSQNISNSVTVIGNSNLIFLEEGAKAEACILNTNSGPIYLGKDSEIMEGTVVRGPFALCENSVLKISTKVYGPSTIGPHSKAGGEVNNSVIFGYSNKAHDGFLGNSVSGL